MAFAQSIADLPLQDALIQIAKQQKLSLIFNPVNIPNKNVKPVGSSEPLASQLKAILKGTELFFEIKDEQIYLLKKHKIFGYIEDGQTGERLISASVFLPSEGNYDLSNTHGFFSTSTTKDSTTLEASYLGYNTLSKKVSLEEMDQAIIISLKPDGQLKEIIISDALVSNDLRNYIELNKGTDILLYNTQACSAVGGEPDIFQAMIRQSGINAGTDGIGGIHVRGGRNDQNLILYDGVELYQPNHAFGLYSIVNSSVINQTRLYKQGASGALSGRLSSIMDIRTKDPDLRAAHVSVQASTLASQATIEIPLIKNKLAIMLTGRRTHVDPFIGPLTEKEFEEINSSFNFKDFSFKAYGKINNKSRLFLTAYSGSDHFSESQMDTYDLDFGEYYNYNSLASYDWSNKFASLRYNRILGKTSFINVSLSKYIYGYDNLYLQNESLLSTGLPDYYGRTYSGFGMGNDNTKLKIQLESITPSHHFQYGISANHRNYQVGTIIFEDLSTPFDSTMPPPEIIPIETETYDEYESNEVVLYLSDKLKTSDKLLLDFAAYASYFTSRNLELQDTFQTINFYGYFKLQYQISEHINIGSSVGKYIQNEHLINIGDNGFPNDTWLPSTEEGPTKIAYQAEIFTGFKKGAHNFKVSSFLKNQTGLILFETAADLPTLYDLLPLDWDLTSIIGSSIGFGFEFEHTFIRKNKWELKSIYTYNRTTYKNPIINDGLAYPFDFSIPHTISLGANFHFRKNLSLGLDWYYSSGKPYSLYYSPTEYTPLAYNYPTELEQLSGYNDLNLPANHKLNISLSTHWKWNQVRNDFYLGVQNIYNRKNLIYKYEFDDPDYGLIEKEQAGFPLLPMLRWRLSI